MLLIAGDYMAPRLDNCLNPLQESVEQILFDTKEILLRPRCKSHELKQVKSFYVFKYDKTSTCTEQDYDISFIAVLQRGGVNIRMSKMNTNFGSCNNVKTESDFTGRGLATIMMKVCFKDQDIIRNGSFREKLILKENIHHFAAAGEIEMTKQCEYIIYVQNTAEPKEAAIGYLKAAYGSGIKWMYARNRKCIRLLETQVAIREYGTTEETIVKFKQDWGFDWYFCKLDN